MKYLLYIFLVLATLFTGIYLLPKHTPLFEYYRLRPVFETASIPINRVIEAVSKTGLSL